MDAPSKSRHITQGITLWVISFFIGRYNGLEAGGFTSAAGAAPNSTTGAGPEGEVHGCTE